VNLSAAVTAAADMRQDLLESERPLVPSPATAGDKRTRAEDLPAVYDDTPPWSNHDVRARRNRARRNKYAGLRESTGTYVELTLAAKATKYLKTTIKNKIAA